MKFCNKVWLSRCIRGTFSIACWKAWNKKELWYLVWIVGDCYCRWTSKFMNFDRKGKVIIDTEQDVRVAGYQNVSGPIDIVSAPPLSTAQLLWRSSWLRLLSYKTEGKLSINASDTCQTLYRNQKNDEAVTICQILMWFRNEANKWTCKSLFLMVWLL